MPDDLCVGGNSHVKLKLLRIISLRKKEPHPFDHVFIASLTREILFFSAEDSYNSEIQ